MFSKQLVTDTIAHAMDLHGRICEGCFLLVKDH